jgi:hypothetical protein
VFQPGGYFSPSRKNLSVNLIRSTHSINFTKQAAYEGLEDAGIPLHEIFKTRTGVFVAGYCPFLPSVDAPDETFLRSSAMSSIADHGTSSGVIVRETWSSWP